MRWLCVLVIAAGCGEDTRNDQMDAPIGMGSDATVMDAPGPLPQTCAAYCAEIDRVCTGAAQQYLTVADCMASCENFPPGVANEQTGNTLGCRIYHTEAARGDAAMHCTHAGPSGGGQCGTTCQGFCSIVQAECSGQWGNNCNTRCMNMLSPTGMAYSTSATTGNSRECRLLHATKAAVDPAMFCDDTDVISPTCQ